MMPSLADTKDSQEDFADRQNRRQAQKELRTTKEKLEKANRALIIQRKKLKRSIKELSFLFEASKKVTSTLSLSEVLDSVLDLLMERFKAYNWSIRILDDDGYLRIKSQRGLSPEFVRFAERKPTMDSYSGECFLKNKVIIVKDAERVSKPLSTNLGVNEGIQSFALVPIATEEEVLGVLAGACKKEKGHFSGGYSKFMQTLCHQLALAVRNAKLYEEVKNFSNELEKQLEKRTQQLQEKNRLLAQSEKLAALGEMADRVAHETRNPLVSMGGFARRIQRELPAHDPLRKYIDIVIDGVERLERMVYSITEYKKYISVDFKISSITTAIEGALERIESKLEARHITVKKHLLPDPLLVRIDKSNMEFLFLNFFENAIEAMGKQGTLSVTARMKNEGCLEVVIADTGKGIAEEDLKRIYNPFFTSRLSGAGLGLTIAHKIVKDHSGVINVKSEPGKGTVFSIELPLAKPTNNQESGLQKSAAQNREEINAHGEMFVSS